MLMGRARCSTMPARSPLSRSAPSPRCTGRSPKCVYGDPFWSTAVTRCTRSPSSSTSSCGVVARLGVHSHHLVPAAKRVHDEVLQPVRDGGRVRIDDDQHPLAGRLGARPEDRLEALDRLAGCCGGHPRSSEHRCMTLVTCTGRGVWVYSAAHSCTAHPEGWRDMALRSPGNLPTRERCQFHQAPTTSLGDVEAAVSRDLRPQTPAEVLHICRQSLFAVRNARPLTR